MNNSTKIIASVVGLAVVLAVIFLSMQSQRTGSIAQTPPATQELTTAPTPGISSAASPDTNVAAVAPASGYKDGTYTASASYRTPESTEPISVTLTLKSGVVTDVSIATNPQASETRRYQSQFVAGYKQFVVGKNIDSITISRVSGSSLTSGGFKAALEKIKAEAKA